MGMSECVRVPFGQMLDHMLSRFGISWTAPRSLPPFCSAHVLQLEVHGDGPALLLEDPLGRGPSIELTFVEVPYWWLEADLKTCVQSRGASVRNDCGILPPELQEEESSGDLTSSLPRVDHLPRVACPYAVFSCLILISAGIVVVFPFPSFLQMFCEPNGGNWQRDLFSSPFKNHCYWGAFWAIPGWWTSAIPTASKLL